MSCPTCGSEDRHTRKLTHVPGSGESDLTPVAIWDPCKDFWHDKITCGEDFCEDCGDCGDCLACYGEDDCAITGRSHRDQL